jgi:hypothetical protein
LDDSHFAERAAARDGVRSLVGQNGARADSSPWRRLGRRHARRERRHAQGQPEAGADQSDPAPTERSAARLARMKSRFIMVMVSMLICFGQAS